MNRSTSGPLSPIFGNEPRTLSVVLVLAGAPFTALVADYVVVTLLQFGMTLVQRIVMAVMFFEAAGGAIAFSTESTRAWWRARPISCWGLLVANVVQPFVLWQVFRDDPSINLGWFTVAWAVPVGTAALVLFWPRRSRAAFAMFATVVVTLAYLYVLPRGNIALVWFTYVFTYKLVLGFASGTAPAR